MAYMHIDNLYKATDILRFKECYALEKIHGTSARISYKSGRVDFFAGGSKHEDFIALFNKDNLLAKFAEIIPDGKSCAVYGETYGGKLQGMSQMYGTQLKFVCFEVKIGGTWLNVPDAEDVVKKLGLEFVAYDVVTTDIETLDQCRDADSVQAVRNGMGEGHPREGIVLRPMVEVKKNNGKRIIAKHKASWSSETKTPRKVGVDLKAVAEAEEIVREWVTLERIKHVVDALTLEKDVASIGKLIKGMVADIEREGKGEVVMSQRVGKEIGRATAVLFKEYLNASLREEGE